MRGALLAALTLLPMTTPALAQDAVEVQVRIEGAYGQIWSGRVNLEGTFDLTATSGRTHTLEARTPLGAIVAAGRAGGPALQVTDEYSDFVVLGVAGEYWYDTRWWDYRVDWVEPNYGAQVQWLAWGEPAHPLRDGAEVLWYVDTFAMTPLRAKPLATVPGAPCAHALFAETLLADPVHNPGQPWPPLVWRPVQAARVAGAAQGQVAAGIGVGFGGAGQAWVEEQPLPLTPLVHYIRSPRLALACPSG